MTGIGGPIRPSGNNGTSDSIMTKKTPKLGKINQFGQGKIIILTPPMNANLENCGP